MKTLLKSAAILLVAGPVALAAAPASAHVGVSVNLGLYGPPVAPPPPPPAYGLPEYCYGPGYYTACSYPVYGEPVFWNGFWFNGAPYRTMRGRREFWVNGGWHVARARGGEFRR
jgi:hypothetical protein